MMRGARLSGALLFCVTSVHAYRRTAVVLVNVITDSDPTYQASLVATNLNGRFELTESSTRKSVEISGVLRFGQAPARACTGAMSLVVFDATSCPTTITSTPQTLGEILLTYNAEGHVMVGTSLTVWRTLFSIDQWNGRVRAIFGKTVAVRVAAGVCGPAAPTATYTAPTYIACGIVADVQENEQIDPYVRPVYGSLIVMAALVSSVIIIAAENFKLCGNLSRIIPYMNAFSLGAFLSEAAIYTTWGAEILDGDALPTSMFLLGIGLAFIIHWIFTFPPNARLGGGVYHDPGRISVLYDSGAFRAKPSDADFAPSALGNSPRNQPRFALEDKKKTYTNSEAVIVPHDPWYERPAAAWPLIVVLILGRSLQKFLDGIFVAVSFRNCVGDDDPWNFPIHILYRELTTELCVFYILRVVGKISLVGSFSIHVCISMATLVGTLISAYAIVPQPALGSLSTICGALLFFLSLSQLAQVVLNTRTWLERVLVFFTAFLGTLAVLLTNLHDIHSCMSESFTFGKPQF
eukprot:GEMP01015449.1.p1 GENE.GEMP01015449.1~~GEMP01015449.1.p1  ORF type:complete len:551 (+),score=73.84 GEMP01015449.1:93-1655(+)